MRLAVEEINAKVLSIGGQKMTLQLDAQDEANDSRTATQMAQRLVDDNVIAVINHRTLGASIPASKTYSDAGIVQICRPPPIRLTRKRVSRRRIALWGPTRNWGRACKYAVNGMSIKSVAIVDDATAYGQGLANVFEQCAQSLGLKVMSHDTTNDKAVDFHAILTKFKEKKPRRNYVRRLGLHRPSVREAGKNGSVCACKSCQAMVCVPTNCPIWRATLLTTSSARKPVFRSCPLRHAVKHTT